MNPKKLPAFRREDRNKKKRIRTSWRSPKGIHSKMRHAFRGRAAVVSSGYRAPVAMRHKTEAGSNIVLVSRVAQLEGLDPKSNELIIASTVGARRRLELIEAAKAFTIRNISNPLDYAASVKAAQHKRRAERAELAKAKKEHKGAAKPQKDEEKSEEKKKEEESAEKEKILTQRS